MTWLKISGLEEELMSHFSDQEPFGPIVAPVVSPKLLSFFFDDANAIVAALRRAPSLIVGRRGAGKTALLEQQRLSHPERQLNVLLEAPDSFLKIVQAIERLSSSFVFVEHVASLWRVLFWVAVFRKSVEERALPKQLDSDVRNFLDHLGGREGDSPYQDMAKMISWYGEIGAELGDIETASQLPIVDGRGVLSIQEISEKVESFLEQKGLVVRVLMDSLEEFPLNETSMGHALAGLLKTVGEMDGVLRVICCLPAELYHSFLELSSNPNKDFSRQVFLHWHAGELTRLGAVRLSTWLRLRAEEFFHKKIRKLDLSSREGVAAFWSQVLPTKIMNATLTEERPLPYILRHTQLLPRQFLIYLNRIFALQQDRFGLSFPIAPECIRDGLEEAEVIVAQEVFNGYKHVFPGLQEACVRCIPHLGNNFEFGKLHRVFNRRGKWVEGVNGDFEKFLTMLKAAGVIGRSLRKSTDPNSDDYLQGVFEYTEAHRLVVSSEDRLCLHPIFTRQFAARRASSGQIPVYPYGTDIGSIDRRPR